MPNPSRRPSLRPGAVLAAGVAVAIVAAVGASGASGPSMPAATPTDASDAALLVVNRVVTPKPTTTRGFTGYQTVTVRPPSNRVVLQGFATISGGNTSAVIITSTSATPARFQVKLRFPGEEGTPGKLHLRVQMMPKL